MSKKNILITGGAGFIGSNFAINQLNNGNNVIIYDSFTYAGHLVNIKQIEDKIKIINASILEEDKITKILFDCNIDVIVNFAAESHVDNSINSPDVFIETNILGTYKLLKASLNYYNNLDNNRKDNFKYIQISTDEVYGSLGDSGKFSEDSKISPNSPYSASKASGDLLTRAWFETYNLPTIITNCSNNYGPRQLPEKLIPVVIFSAINNKQIPVYGDGKNIRDWIYVDDHSNAIDLVIKKGVIGQTYCIGSNNERSNIDLVKDICNILDDLKPRSDGKSYIEQIYFVKDRAGHDRRYAIDNSKIVNDLGFTCITGLEDGIRKTVKWYLDSKEWYDSIIVKLNQGFNK